MTLHDTLETALKRDPDFVTGEGELKKWVVINKAQNCDARLIELLLAEPALKEKFFFEVNGVAIFHQALFTQFVEQKNYLNDSYTAYRNKVGLTIDGRYLKQRNEVVLVWPFKDCVLEGGQTAEEQKRDEVFFNEVLAQDEINQLLEPKVLTNAKRHTTTGEQPFAAFARDAALNRQRGLPANTITDNLVVKGNNLLALHTLREQFAGKVKLIYIDPPYNTGNDGFKYNDRFNRSSWLTFMKNRLEVARSLLKADGVIFVHCDDNEQAYLKATMDEVFGADNFICTMVRIAKSGGGHDSQFLAVEYDYVLFYARNRERLVVNKMIVNTEEDKKYKYKDKHCKRRGRYYLRDLDYRGSYSKSLDYPITLPNGERIYAGGKFGKPNTWRWSKEKLAWGLKNDFIVIDEKKRKVYIKQYQFVDNNDNLRVRKIPYRALVKFLNTEGSKEISKLFDGNVFSYPKPESFIKYILEIATEEHDIVLDYHLGSGTTAAVAHKMNRQYIGIEQMDYIRTVAVERLKKVIAGEQGGVSKAVRWQGGGSFIYLELKQYNQAFVDKIRAAKTAKRLMKIWQDMKQRSFLHYNVDVKKQDEHMREFEQLTVPQQKAHLLTLLNKNQLYVNLSSMEDKDFRVSKAEKKVTTAFYDM